MKIETIEVIPSLISKLETYLRGIIEDDYAVLKESSTKEIEDEKIVYDTVKIYRRYDGMFVGMFNMEGLNIYGDERFMSLIKKLIEKFERIHNMEITVKFFKHVEGEYM